MAKNRGDGVFQGGLIPQCTVCINIKTNKFLSGLNTSKDPSLDGISSKFLQDSAKVLPLNLLFPDQCEIAKLNPLFKRSLSGLRQLLATESPLKMMKNAFYFTLKALFIIKILKFLF